MINIKNILSFGRQEVYGDWLVKIYIPGGYIPTRIYYIHSGNCYFFHEGKKVRLTPGLLYLIPFTTNFTPVSDENSPLDHSYIDFDLMPPIISRDIYSLDPAINKLTRLATDMFIQIAGNKPKTIYSPFDINAETLNLLTSSAALLIREMVELNNIRMPKDKVAISIMNELFAHIDSDISIDDLAKKHYMSPDAIIRNFKRTFDKTPYAFLRELRLRTASYLIRSGEKLDDVARATNYSSTSALLHALNKK